MPFLYRIHPEEELMEVEVTGLIGVTELVSRIIDLFHDPLFDPGYDIFIDCSDARMGRVTFELAEAMVAIGLGNEGRRMAIVLPEGPGVDYARRYVKLRDDPKRVRGFESLGEARAWLRPAETGVSGSTSG